jgi:hypothetical protein
LSSGRYTEDVSSRSWVSNDDSCGVGITGAELPAPRRPKEAQFTLLSGASCRSRNEGRQKIVFNALLKSGVE